MTGEPWGFSRVERCQETMVEKLKDVAATCTTEESRLGCKAALNSVRTTWKAFFEEQSSIGGDSSLTTMSDDQVHLRNMNLILRRRLRRHNSVAKELLRVICGDETPSGTASVDDVMEELAMRSKEMCAAIAESQEENASNLSLVADPPSFGGEGGDGDMESSSSSSGGAKVASCVIDFWRLADFKLRHAAQVIGTRLEDLAPASNQEADIAQLRFSQIQRELEIANEKLQGQLNKQRDDFDKELAAMNADFEAQQHAHEADMEQLRENHALEVERLTAIHEDEIALTAHDFELRMQQALQQQRDETSLTTEQMNAERAAALEKMRATLAEERRRHEATVQRLKQETMPASRTPHGHRRSDASSTSTSMRARPISGGRRASGGVEASFGTLTESVAFDFGSFGQPSPRTGSAGRGRPFGKNRSDTSPSDPHNAVVGYSEDNGTRWDGEPREALIQLLREKQAELQMQQATFNVQTRSRVMEWESTLREAIGRYEGEIQSLQHYNDREVARTRDLATKLDEANHRISMLRVELQSETASSREKLEEIERDAKNETRVLRIDFAKATNDLAASKHKIGELEQTLEEERTAADQRERDANQALLVLRRSLDIKVKASKDVQCTLLDDTNASAGDGRGRTPRSSRRASVSPGLSPSRRGSVTPGHDIFAASMPVASHPTRSRGLTPRNTEAVSREPSPIDPHVPSPRAMKRGPKRSKKGGGRTPRAGTASVTSATASAAVSAAGSVGEVPLVDLQQLSNRTPLMSSSPTNHDFGISVTEPTRATFTNKPTAAISPMSASQQDKPSAHESLSDSDDDPILVKAHKIGGTPPSPHAESQEPAPLVAKLEDESSQDKPLVTKPEPLKPKPPPPAPTPEASQSQLTKKQPRLSTDMLDVAAGSAGSTNLPSPGELSQTQKLVITQDDAGSARTRATKQDGIGYDLRSAAHAILSDETLRAAVESMATVSGDGGVTLEDKVNAATKMPPTVFGILPSSVTEKRFLAICYSFAVLCDFALPAASRARLATNEARLLDACPDLKKGAPPPVQPVTPVDLVAVSTFVLHNNKPPGLPPATQQLPGEAKQYHAVLDGIRKIGDFVRTGGYPTELTSVTWRDLENWRFMNRNNAVAIPPSTVQKFLTLIIEYLLHQKRYAIFTSKRLKHREPGAAASAASAIDGQLPFVGPPQRPASSGTASLHVSSVTAEGLPHDGSIARAKSRPVQHLVDAVATAAQSARDHIKTARMAQKRWGGLRTSAAPSAVSVPSELSGTNMTPSPRKPLPPQPSTPRRR